MSAVSAECHLPLRNEYTAKVTVSCKSGAALEVPNFWKASYRTGRIDNPAGHIGVKAGAVVAVPILKLRDRFKIRVLVTGVDGVSVKATYALDREEGEYRVSGIDVDRKRKQDDQDAA